MRRDGREKGEERRHATSRKFADSVPDEVTGIF
jgi:hypothetical protein